MIAFLKSFPTLLKLLDKAVVWYTGWRIKDMHSDVREGLKKAIEQDDQRDLEEAIGNPDAGEPVDIPGTSIVDSLPGVRK